jgi:GT2 family glycosyltransferase
MERYILCNPKVLIAVLNYNSIESTVKTIQCFYNQSYTNYDLLLVDNASDDGCVNKLKNIFKHLDIAVLPRNLGYTGGNNYALHRGIERNYDHVIISNNDIELGENAVAYLIESSILYHNIGVVGGIEVDCFTGNIRTVGGIGYNLWISRTKWLKHHFTKSTNQHIVDYVQGALILFTKKALNAGIMFDNNLFMYCEEVDLGYQLNKAGFVSIVDDRVIVNHSNMGFMYKSYIGYLHQRNRYYIVKKYGNWYHKAFYSMYVIFIEIPGKLFLRGLQGHLMYALACAQGHLDAIRGKMGNLRLLFFK